MGEKRRILTPAERVAKIEAELAAAREAAEAKANKQISKLLDRRATLMAQINERVDKLGVIDVELVELGYEIPTADFPGDPVAEAEAVLVGDDTA